MTGKTRRKCSVCHETKAQQHYSDHEWENHGNRTCNECKEQAAADDAATGQTDEVAKERQKSPEKADEESAKAGNPQQLKSGDQALWASPTGFWQTCFFHDPIPSLNSCTIRLPLEMIAKIVPVSAVIPFDAAKVGTAHEIQIGIEEFPEQSDEHVNRADHSVSSNNSKIIEILSSVAKTQSEVAAFVKPKREDDGYAKLLYQNKTIAKFTQKFPKDVGQYCRWSYALNEYKTNNGGSKISSDILFQKVSASLKGPDQTGWFHHRSTKYQEYLKDNNKEDDEDAREAFAETFDNITSIQRYAVLRLVRPPSYSWVRSKFDNIRCLKNERPSDTMNRITKYQFQYKKFKEEINPLVEMKLPTRSPRENVQLLREVFIEKNYSIGPLNERARMKICSKWQKLQRDVLKDVNSGEDQNKLYEALVRFISTELDSIVSPPMDVDNMDEDKRWQTHLGYGSLFDIQTDSDKSTSGRGKKRKRGNDDSSFQESKRYKGDNTPCPYGKKCRDLFSGKGCPLRHSYSDLKAARKSIKANKSKPSKQDKSGSQPKGFKRKFQFKTNRNKPSSDVDPRWKIPCNRGVKCPYWQNGNCNYHHDPKQMTCGTCNKPGHSSSRCYRNRGDKSSSTAVKHYTPTNPNHDGVQPHKPMMVMHDGQQTSYITPGYLESFKAEVRAEIRSEMQNQAQSQTQSHSLALGTEQQDQTKDGLNKSEKKKMFQLLNRAIK